jgi:hypothetical protein
MTYGEALPLRAKPSNWYGVVVSSLLIKPCGLTTEMNEFCREQMEDVMGDLRKSYHLAQFIFLVDPLGSHPFRVVHIPCSPDARIGMSMSSLYRAHRAAKRRRAEADGTTLNQRLVVIRLIERPSAPRLGL